MMEKRCYSNPLIKAEKEREPEGSKLQSKWTKTKKVNAYVLSLRYLLFLKKMMMTTKKKKEMEMENVRKLMAKDLLNWRVSVYGWTKVKKKASPLTSRRLDCDRFSIGIFEAFRAQAQAASMCRLFDFDCDSDELATH